jgi:hypothetical protein
MHAYANPNFTDIHQARTMQANGDPLDLADGYGLIRFHKPTRSITFEAWPRHADVTRADPASSPVGRSPSASMTMMEGRSSARFPSNHSI